MGFAVRAVGVVDVAVDDTPIVDLDPASNGVSAKDNMYFVTIENTTSETLSILGPTGTSDTLAIATLGVGEVYEPPGPIPNSVGSLRLLSTATGTTARITYWQVG